MVSSTEDGQAEPGLKRMGQMHDSGYKFLFSAPEFVRDLILGFVPDEWLHGLDFSTLEPYPGSYITEDFRHRADDVVWRLKVGGEWIYLYLLIEFQSTVDPYMALRMMVYQGLLFQDMIRKNDARKGRLPPVLPIVLYNGRHPWTACQDVYELIAPVPSLVEQFKPHARYLLIDEQAYSDTDLASQRNLMAAIFRLEQNPAATAEVLLSLDEWLHDRPQLERMVVVWVRAMLMHRPGLDVHLPEVDNLRELKIMLADHWVEWGRECKAEGMQQGMQQGEALALQKLLAKRFGAVTPAVLEAIAHASPEQIDIWLDRLLDAENMDAVFAP